MTKTRNETATRKGEPITGRKRPAVVYPFEGVDAEESPKARAELEARFRKTWGRAWASVAPMLESLARNGRPMTELAAMNAEHEEATELTGRALAVIEDIRRWNAEHPGSRRLEFPREAFQWAEVRAVARAAKPRSLFERAVAALSPRGVERMPPFGRTLSDTELADVLLLLGYWPEKASTRRKSVAEIVAVVMRSVRAARTRGIAASDPNASGKPGRRRKK